MIRTYSELITLETFEERLNYLRLSSQVGLDTFGYDRIFNQRFYTSLEWRRARNHVIARDLGLDLGSTDVPIIGSPVIHHMNPITLDDIRNKTEFLLDPEFLICCSFETHNAIHYGIEVPERTTLVERLPNDTCPWKR